MKLYSLLDRAGNGVGEALLQAEEDDDSGQGAQRNAGHNHAVVDDVTGHQVGNEHRHGGGVRSLHDDLRPQVGVPRAHEGDGGSRRIGRLHHRDEHPDEDLELVQTVDSRSLDRILREGTRAVAEVHDQERGREARDEEADPGVQELRLGHHLEQRNQNRNERNHHRQHQDAHQAVLILVVIDFEAVARDGGNRQREESLQQGGREGVLHRVEHVLLSKQILQVLHQVNAGDHAAAEDLLRVIERRDERPVQRENGNK